MTTQQEIEQGEVDLASRRNTIALVVLQGIEELLGSYDPDDVLVEGVVADMVWEIEDLLMDASYEIEVLVEEFHADRSGGTTLGVEEVTLDAEDEAADFSGDFFGDAESPGSEVTT